jgi:uncharacterized protein with GYD domain
MAKYVMFFSYKPEVWNQLLMKPWDRPAAVRDMPSTLGGAMESLYYMSGDRDGFVVIDVPDSETAAAAAIAVTSTGAFAHFETRRVISAEEMPEILERAASARESYRPPGQ